MSAEDFKIKGNKAVAERRWAQAVEFYSAGLEKLKILITDKELEVPLLSNRSFAYWHLQQYEAARIDAERVIQLDSRFDKGYLRLATALESLGKKCSKPDDLLDCPVYNCYKAGMSAVPGSMLLENAMKVSFPWLYDSHQPSQKRADVGKKKANRKLGQPTKAQRDACKAIDIRGSAGVSDLRVNGIYKPSTDVSGGWPIYKKKKDLESSNLEDSDEDDDLILEYHSGLSEWMIKHSSWRGSHRSFLNYKCDALQPPEACPGMWQGLDEKKNVVRHNLNIMALDDRVKEDERAFSRNRPDCQAIEVRGAMDKSKPSNINGVYEPTDQPSGGWPLYRKLNGSGGTGIPSCMVHNNAHCNCSTVWMEFNPHFKSWQVKPTSCLGTTRSWAYVICSTHQGSRPEMCTAVWEVLDAEAQFKPQEGINVLTLEAWKEDTKRCGRCWQDAKQLNVRGAVGSYAAAINGIYDPAEEFNGGYLKSNDSAFMIEYCRKKRQWQMRMRTVMGSYAYITNTSSELLTPDNCCGAWHVLMGASSSWEAQPNISVMTTEARSALDSELYGDKLGKAEPLDVRGATGANAFKINGVYEPTQEISGEWPVYQRKGSFDYWLEFNTERQNWQIKTAANRGMDSAFAYVDASSSPGRPEECKGPWWVFTGCKTAEFKSGWEVQRSVSVLTVADRFLEDAQICEARRKTCVPIDIRGASGPRSAGLNGVFAPTDEMHGGWPVYIKRDDPEWYLEYDACPRKWMIRPSSCRGSTRGRAYILCTPELRPEQAVGTWRMSDGKGGWAVESSIVVRTEAAAIEEDRVAFAARRVTAVPLDLRGMPRQMSYVNGVYEPTNEACSGWPVYKKRGNENHWIEYNSSCGEWQVKPSTCRGLRKNWAYISSDPAHPELCTGSYWMVLENGKHARHDGVTLVSVEQRLLEDKATADQRRAACFPIFIAGVQGEAAACVEGLYEVSPTRSCGGWPCYVRRSRNTQSVLEFNVYAMSWTITFVGDPAERKSKAKETDSVGDSLKRVAESKEAFHQPVASCGSSEKTGISNAKESEKGSSSFYDSLNQQSYAKSESKIQASEIEVKAVINPFTSPSPVLVAFVEVYKIQRPELFKEDQGPNLWKILSGDKFEPQATVTLTAIRQSPAAAASSSSSSSAAVTSLVPEVISTKRGNELDTKFSETEPMPPVPNVLSNSESKPVMLVTSVQLSKEVPVLKTAKKKGSSKSGQVKDAVKSSAKLEANQASEAPSLGLNKLTDKKVETIEDAWTEVATSRKSRDKIVPKGVLPGSSNGSSNSNDARGRRTLSGDLTGQSVLAGKTLSRPIASSKPVASSSSAPSATSVAASAPRTTLANMQPLPSRTTTLPPQPPLITLVTVPATLKKKEISLLAVRTEAATKSSTKDTANGARVANYSADKGVYALSPKSELSALAPEFSIPSAAATFYTPVDDSSVASSDASHTAKPATLLVTAGSRVESAEPMYSYASATSGQYYSYFAPQPNAGESPNVDSELHGLVQDLLLPSIVSVSEGHNLPQAGSRSYSAAAADMEATNSGLSSTRNGSVTSLSSLVDPARADDDDLFAVLRMTHSANLVIHAENTAESGLDYFSSGPFSYGYDSSPFFNSNLYPLNATASAPSLGADTAAFTSLPLEDLDENDRFELECETAHGGFATSSYGGLGTVPPVGFEHSSSSSSPLTVLQNPDDGSIGGPSADQRSGRMDVFDRQSFAFSPNSGQKNAGVAIGDEVTLLSSSQCVLLRIHRQHALLFGSDTANIMCEKCRAEAKEFTASPLDRNFTSTFRGTSVLVREYGLATCSYCSIDVTNETKKNITAMFMRELEVLTEYRHPNILPLVAACMRPMALVYRLDNSEDVQTLRSLLYSDRRRSLTPAKCEEIIYGILSALAFLQGRAGDTHLHAVGYPGITHCNLLPQHVLVNVDTGHPHLSSFGHTRYTSEPPGEVTDDVVGAQNDQCMACSFAENTHQSICRCKAYAPWILRARSGEPGTDVACVGLMVLELLLQMEADMFGFIPLARAISEFPIATGVSELLVDLNIWSIPGALDLCGFAGRLLSEDREKRMDAVEALAQFKIRHRIH